MGGGGELIFGDSTTAKASVSNEPDKNLFVLKLKDSAITLSINYLKKKGLFPDSNDDDDDDYVFGDDDFPSAEAAGGEEAAEEEEAADVDDPLAMLGGVGAEELYKVTQVEEGVKASEAAAEEEEAAADIDDPLAMLGGMGAEELYKVTAMAEDQADEGVKATEEDGEPYPDIKYGCATPERLTTDKMEKKMKKIIKEGGKRGVEIEGAADMGGLQFFCTTMDEP